MKTSISAIVLAATMTTFVVGDPQPPAGTLTSSEITVITGNKPTLTWLVNHPSRDINDIVTIKSNGVIKTKKDVRVDVYMLGIGVASNNGLTQEVIQAKINLGGGYQHLFTGKGKDVSPTTALISNEVSEGTRIKFQASYTNWRDHSSEHVIILKDDDAPPTELDPNNGTALEDYLSTLLKNDKLDMGPHDLIYCAELTHTNKGDSGYNYQDCIVLLRFTDL